MYISKACLTYTRYYGTHYMILYDIMCTIIPYNLYHNDIIIDNQCTQYVPIFDHHIYLQDNWMYYLSYQNDNDLSNSTRHVIKKVQKSKKLMKNGTKKCLLSLLKSKNRHPSHFHYRLSPINRINEMALDSAKFQLDYNLQLQHDQCRVPLFVRAKWTYPRPSLARNLVPKSCIITIDTVEFENDTARAKLKYSFERNWCRLALFWWCYRFLLF